MMGYYLTAYVISLAIISCNAITVSVTTKGSNSTGSISLTEDEEYKVDFMLQDVTTQDLPIYIQMSSKSGWEHAKVRPHKFIFGAIGSDDTGTLGLAKDGSLLGSFNITGEFVGFSNLNFATNSTRSKISNTVNVKVQRHDPYGLSKVFGAVIVILVTIAFVSLGCAIDFNIVLETLKRPIAPIIGVFSQFLFMPLVSYGIGYGLFSDNAPMWLALFLAGCAPGGGASNMWTYMLGGSLNLSISMTFISTILALAALPAWILALGGTIYSDGEFTSALPFGNIAGLIIGLVVPCGIGIALQKYKPEWAKKVERGLKPMSLFFIIFIAIFGAYANYYIFFFFTWKVFVGGMCLPWLGFLFGFVVSLVCRRPWEELIAISVETGIQNAGIAIGVLKVSLADYAPLGDITLVVPVAVSMMTPIPLVILFIGMKIRSRFFSTKSIEENPTVLSTVEDVNDYGTNKSNGVES